MDEQVLAYTDEKGESGWPDAVCHDCWCTLVDEKKQAEAERDALAAELDTLATGNLTAQHAAARALIHQAADVERLRDELQHANEEQAVLVAGNDSLTAELATVTAERECALDNAITALKELAALRAIVAGLDAGLLRRYAETGYLRSDGDVFIRNLDDAAALRELADKLEAACG